MTAIENKEKFGEEAAQTLLSNFYVDDLLKSVENEDMPVHLISEVTGQPKFTSLQATAKGFCN